MLTSNFIPLAGQAMLQGLASSFGSCMFICLLNCLFIVVPSSLVGMITHTAIHPKTQSTLSPACHLHPQEGSSATENNLKVRERATASKLLQSTLQ